MIRILLISAAVLLSGCSVISKEVLKDVDRSVTLELAQARPEAFIGRKVLWGGVILNTENLENTTEIEVLETELSFSDRTTDGKSRGRFLIETQGFLDANVYKPSMNITVAGEIKGAATKKIGKMDYTYPVIKPIEMQVYEFAEQPEYPYPSPWRYGPNYPYGPNAPYGPYWQYQRLPHNPAYRYPYSYPYNAPPPATGN